MNLTPLPLINKDLGADAAYTAQVEGFLRGLDPGIADLLSRRSMMKHGVRFI